MPHSEVLDATPQRPTHAATRLFARRRSSRLWVRLALGFGSLVLLMTLVVALSIVQFRALASSSEQMIQHDLQRMLQVQQIDEHVQGHGSAMARLLTSPRNKRESIYAVVDEEYAAIEHVITELSKDSSDAGTMQRLRLMAERSKHYREAFIDVVTEIEADDLQKASALFNGAGQASMKALLDATKAMLEHERASLRERERETQSRIRQSEWFLAALAAGALVLSVLLAWRTTASVSKPLARVEAAALRVAAGDYSARVDVRGGDELGRVAQAMNILAAGVAEREAEIEYIAYNDRLTGLPNRAMLRRVAEASGPGALSVMLIDVARLRTVNELLGFETGDALLLQVARRLLAVVGPSTESLTGPLLARMPGGVFALLVRAMDRASIERLRERIGAALSTPIECDGQSIDVDLVFGLADGEGADLSIDALLRHAELAVGVAKRSKSRCAWHAADHEQARAGQLTLLSKLRDAADTGELEMWLQPKQCLRTSRTIGMEGLVRWRHPQRGLVSPAEFIPFAEKTGHIGIVTHAMLNAAMSRLAAWSEIAPELSIAVNVSALDIRDEAFTERVTQLARRHRAPLHRLRLEITESSVMEDADRVLPILHSLRETGVQLSIDDFGTGYSSLAYLQRLPVSELKIDRSFVAGSDREPGARALLRTIVELGHSLDMCVTAEGIERAEERALLVELGCDVAQGYLLGRPLDPAAAEAYVASLATRTAALA